MSEFIPPHRQHCWHEDYKKHVWYCKGSNKPQTNNAYDHIDICCVCQKERISRSEFIIPAVVILAILLLIARYGWLT